MKRIGPAPPLRPIVALPSRIADVALPSSAIRPEQYVHGRLRLLNHCVSLTSPTVCARDVLGGLRVPLFQGSRVHVPDLDFQLVLVALPDGPAKNALLMRGVRGAVKYYLHYRRAQLVHDEVEFDVLSMDGIAARRLVYQNGCSAARLGETALAARRTGICAELPRAFPAP